MIRVVPASGWLSTPLSAAERTHLRQSGILPVSDAFMPFMASSARYQVVYGGRGSGKSEATARKLIARCHQLPYFRCIYARKVADTIRDSQFALLQKAIADMGLAHLFTVNKATMAIVHQNGNNFIAKGVDKPEKVKSTDEPSHLWCEELPEFNETDFATLDDSIRTHKAACETIVTFNPVMETSWVRRRFFHPDDSHAPAPAYAPDLFLYRSTFRDNWFIDQAAYHKTLLRNAAGNKNRLRVNVAGDWGLPENKDPWLYAFDAGRHVRRNLAFLPTFPVYLSFDFNRDPVTCIAAQMSPQKGTRDSFVHVIKEFGGRLQLHQLCQRIRAAYPGSILFVTGDSSGRKGDIAYNSAHDTAYTLIRKHLGIHERQVQPNVSNLLHENSRMLLNGLFYSYPNLCISEEGCPNLINDCELAQTDPKSEKPHALRKDRDQFKMDYFDGLRYFFQRWFHDFAQSNYFKLIGSESSKS